MKRKLREELAQLEKEFGRPIIADGFDDIREEYPYPKVAEYLDQVRDEVLSNMAQFLDKDGEDGEEQARAASGSEDERYRRFLVNVLVDNRRRAPAGRRRDLAELPEPLRHDREGGRPLRPLAQRLPPHQGRQRPARQRRIPRHPPARRHRRAGGLAGPQAHPQEPAGRHPGLRRDVPLLDERDQAGADQDRRAGRRHRRSGELPHPLGHGPRLPEDLQGEGGVRLRDGARDARTSTATPRSSARSACRTSCSPATGRAWPRWSRKGCGWPAAQAKLTTRFSEIADLVREAAYWARTRRPVGPRTSIAPCDEQRARRVEPRRGEDAASSSRGRSSSTPTAPRSAR